MKSFLPALLGGQSIPDRICPADPPGVFPHRRRLAWLLALAGPLLGAWLWHYGPFGGLAPVKAVGESLPVALWQVGSTLGDARVLLILALPFCRRHPRLLWALILAALVGWLLTRGLKHLMHLPRPGALPAQGLSAYDKKLSGRYGFPSGHTATIFAFIGIGVAALPRRYAAALVVPGLFVAYARVMLGLHWPIDVVGGALVGILGAGAGILLSERWHWGERPPIQRRLTLFTLAASLSLPFIDTGYPATQPLRVALAIAAAAMIVAILAFRFLNTQPEKPASP